MGDEVLYPSFSFVYGPAFTYLCFFSHRCNASESNFKENLGVQDSQKSFKLNKFTPSINATSVNLWDYMASLKWWFHQQQSDWSEISEWHSSKSSREDMCCLPTSFLLNIQSRIKQELDMPQIQKCVTQYNSPYWCSVPNIRKLACVVPEKNVTEIFLWHRRRRRPVIPICGLR